MSVPVPSSGDRTIRPVRIAHETSNGIVRLGRSRRRSSLVAAGLIAVGLLAGARGVNGEDAVFRFLAVGDVPYSDEQEAAFRRLLAKSEQEDYAFLMHVGDFKAGSAPCSDGTFFNIRDLFEGYPKPVVYTPGDNEWTDCRGEETPPLERLERVREIFFRAPAVLRLGSLGAVHQSRHADFAAFVENYRFSRAGVQFVVVHVVGSSNNRRGDHPPSVQEFERRNAANVAFMKESFAEAMATKARGVAVVIHANPAFEGGNNEAYGDFLDTLRRFLSEFHRPVICIHGDSHYFRIDKPLKDNTGKTFLHFTRVEVFGSPNVAGLAVTVDANDSQVFQFRPVYVEPRASDLVHPRASTGGSHSESATH